jgi:hypothetical protein
MGLAAKKAEPMSFDDMLTQTAKPKAKGKAKSKVPTLDAPDNIKSEVDRYIAAKLAEKTAKAEKDDAGESIINFVRPHQDKAGYDGTYRNSYSVPGTDGARVKYVSSNRFSINADDEEQLHEILGDEFEGLVDRRFEVVLKAEVFQDETLKQELMELMGQRFGAFFDTKVSLKVKEAFDRRVYATVAGKELPTLRTFARPYKPSLR